MLVVWRALGSWGAPPLGRHLSTAADVWATAIKLREKEKRLEVEFSTGETFSYPAEYLRVESPAADARDAAGRPRLVAGRRHVGILGVEPVGAYAIRIEYDDLHRTGIYTWPYLHELGTHKLSRMRQYLRQLRRRGLSRDPPRRRAAAPKGAQQGQHNGNGSSCGSRSTSGGQQGAPT